MSAHPICSQCHLALTQVGQHWICPEHGQVLIDKPFAPLRIFLSYGHDSNEELVRRIKADLEQRGHDVWFDKSEIKAGDDWRRSITDGIVGSHRVLSFLSRHSTRDPGVCRDEIVIALTVKGGNIQTILVESEQEVMPPASIGHIQWLDMHDWKTGHGAVRTGIRQTRNGPIKVAEGDAAWEQWYQAKFAEIVRVVESDESRRFAGEIEILNGYLNPIESKARICQLLSKGFYGRQWLFEAVEKWRTASNDGPSGADRPCGSQSRLFWIMGAPGVGKSAFAAQLTDKRGDTVIAAQFCEWDKPDHRHAPRVVRSLAFQLATRLPDYRKLLLTLAEIAELDRKDAAELFDYLLANPLRSVIHGGRERHLIVIDALDEAGEAGHNPLVEMLAHNAQRLPDWLGLVVTSRPEFDVKTPLQALNPFPLNTQSESNRADIRDYLRRELASLLQNRPDTDRLVGQILEKSEGVFLYVERFCDDVHHGHLSLDRPEQFPQGLGGIFHQYFQRQFPDVEQFRKDVRPALRAILAAREPLPVEILQRLFHQQDEELRDFTRPLASLFPVVIENGSEVIKPYHKALADWLWEEAKSDLYFVSLLEGHRMLAEYGWRQYHRSVSKLTDYALRNTPTHLYEVADDDRLYEMVHDRQIIDAYTYLSWPDHIMTWMCDVDIPERSVSQVPGNWYTLTHQYGSAVDWSCGRCGIQGGPGNLASDASHLDDTPNPTVFPKCPSCGWEGRSADYFRWEKAKTEYERKHPERAATGRIGGLPSLAPVGWQPGKMLGSSKRRRKGAPKNSDSKWYELFIPSPNEGIDWRATCTQCGKITVFDPLHGEEAGESCPSCRYRT